MRLMNYETAEYLREATPWEARASAEAARTDGGAGAIDIEGRTCYVEAVADDGTPEPTVWLHEYLGVRGLSAGLARKIHDAADEGGTIQADDMLRLLPGADPQAHTTCSLRAALVWAGGEIVDHKDE